MALSAKERELLRVLVSEARARQEAQRSARAKRAADQFKRRERRRLERQRAEGQSSAAA